MKEAERRKFEQWMTNVAAKNPAGISSIWERGAREGWAARASESSPLDAFLMKGPLGDVIDAANQRLQVLMTECDGNEKAEGLIQEVSQILRGAYRGAAATAPSAPRLFTCDKISAPHPLNTHGPEPDYPCRNPKESQ